MLENANRQAIIAWLNEHKSQPIRIARKGSALKVLGIAQGVDELEACSAEYKECVLEVELPGVEAALSFHEDRMALHITAATGRSAAAHGSAGGAARGRELCLSLPVSIPYDEVLLSLPAEEAPAQDEPAAEHNVWPYELLVPRID